MTYSARRKVVELSRGNRGQGNDSGGGKGLHVDCCFGGAKPTKASVSELIKTCYRELSCTGRLCSYCPVTGRGAISLYATRPPEASDIRGGPGAPPFGVTCRDFAGIQGVGAPAMLQETVLSRGATGLLEERLVKLGSIPACSSNERGH